MNDEEDRYSEEMSDKEEDSGECLPPKIVSTSLYLDNLEKYGLMFDGEIVESVIWRFESSSYSTDTAVEATCFSQTNMITLTHGKDDMRNLPWPNNYGDVVLFHLQFNNNKKENNHD